MSWQLFDRLRAYFRRYNIYQVDPTLQDQNQLDRITAGGEFLDLSRQHALLQQTALHINRLERYKDFDQMDEVGEITLALDLYADESSLVDPEERHSIVIKARNKRVKRELECLFHETLMIDRQIRPLARYLCKYGDFPAEIILTKNRDGVASIRFMNVYNFTRVATKYDDLVGFFYQDQMSEKPSLMHPWQVMHMRLTNFENIFHPYGRGILDGARKDFKRLRMMEDAALIYRITRAPIKRVFSIPIGNIPTKDVHQYMELIARQFKKRRFVDPATGNVNERYSPLIQEDDFFLPKRCISLETKIPTLNGKENTLQQLIDDYGIERDSFWIYSWDGNKIIPKKAKCVVGPKQSEIVRVNLDDGSHIDCTPDHKFYLKDGTVVNAESLKANVSLLPLYRRKEKLRHGKYVGDYEQVMDPVSGQWEFTHRMILPECRNGFVRHHQNFNRYDNRPDNLKIMAMDDHRKLHSDHGRVIMKELHSRPEMREKFLLGTRNGYGKLNGTDAGRKFASDGAKKGWRTGAYDHTLGKNHVRYKNIDDYKETWKNLLIKHHGSARPACREWNSNEEYREIWKANHVTIQTKVMEWGYKSIEEMTGYKAKASKNWSLLLPHKDEILDLVSTIGPMRSAATINEKYGFRVSKRIMSSFAKEHGWTGGPKGLNRKILSDDEILLGVRTFGSVSKFIEDNKISKNTCTQVLRRSGYSSVRDFLEQPVNHKVVSVEWLPDRQDTYCLEVEDTHCFFAGSGVLIHNSDGTGPSIDTLPGAENLDQIADIEYFKKKMISALKIPFSRVGIGEPSESDGRSLASASPEFAKAIQWVQREIAIGLKKVAIIHLTLKGYNVDDIKNFDLRMTAASAIDELYRIETWASRADIIGVLKETMMFPDEWILRKFTDLTDDEIEENQEEIKKMQEAGLMEPEGGGKPRMPKVGGLGGPKLPEAGEEKVPEIPEPGTPETPAGGEPGEEGLLDLIGAESLDKDERKLLTEYAKFKKNKRIMNEKYEIVYDYMLMTNELDGMPLYEDDSEEEKRKAKLLVEWQVDEKTRKEVIDENARLVVADLDSGEILHDHSGGQVITEADIPK